MQTEAHKSKIEDIPLNKITISPLHFDRTHTDENVDKMVESIQETGVIHPITVRKKGKTYELLAGERRYRALKILKVREVRCSVRICDDATAELLSLKENLVGTEPLSPAEEMRAIARAVEISRDRITSRRDAPDPDRFAKAKSKKRKSIDTDPDPGDMDEEEATTEMQAREKAADSLNVSLSKVNRAVKLSEKLIAAARRAYEKKQISQQQATLLANMSPGEQHKKLPKMLRETQTETTNREALEKLGGKDPDYKASMREVGKLGNHCDAATLIAGALDKAMSPEVAADIEEEFLATVDQTITALERLRQNIHTKAGWAKGKGSSE